MRWMLVCVAVLGCVGAASAQETARFRSRVGAGTVTGTESFTIAATPAGHEVTADITMKRGGGRDVRASRRHLSAAWAPEKYSVEMTGALGNASVTGERKGGVLALAVKTAGRCAGAGHPADAQPRPDGQHARSALPGAAEHDRRQAGGGDGRRPVPVGDRAGHASRRPAPRPARSTGSRSPRRSCCSRSRPCRPRSLRPGGEPAAARLRAGAGRRTGARGIRAGRRRPRRRPVERPAGVTERDVTFKTIDGAPYPGGAVPAGRRAAPRRSW